MSGRYVSRVLESALAPDLKFTAAVLASFADDNGYRIWPAVGEVAYLRGVSERSIQFHLKELRHMAILETVKPATQWFPAQYRLVLEHLPARPPYQPPDRQPWLPGESPGEIDAGVKPASPLPGVKSSAPGVKPTSPDPSQDPSLRTHTTGAREPGVKPASPLTGGESLPLIVAPTRQPGHQAHAYCGRICVPKFLHREFKRALGGPVCRRAKRLRALYVEVESKLDPMWPVGLEPAKFWRAAFAQRFTHQPAAPRRAEGHTSGRPCPHDDLCASRHACIEKTLAEARRKSG